MTNDELLAALRGAVTNPEGVTVEDFRGDISVNYLPDGTVRHWGWLLRHEQNSPARVIAYDIGPLHTSYELRNVSRILDVLADWLDAQEVKQ